METKNIQFYFAGGEIPEHLRNVIKCFEKNSYHFDSEKFLKDIKSNYVLEKVREDLEKLGFTVETGKKSKEKIIFKIPTLYHEEIEFQADAYNYETKTIIEVEAGRAVINNQFLKDFYQASVINECDYLVIAVKKLYRSSKSVGKDFEKVSKFMDGIFNNPRFIVPLKGILIIGY